MVHPNNPIIAEQLSEAKRRHPYSVCLFVRDDAVAVYGADAIVVGYTLGFTITWHEGLPTCVFPLGLQCDYMSTLMHAGHCCDICEMS